MRVVRAGPNKVSIVRTVSDVSVADISRVLKGGAGAGVQKAASNPCQHLEGRPEPVAPLADQVRFVDDEVGQKT